MGVKSSQTLTGEQAKERIRKDGFTIKRWAHKRGFDFRLVSDVIRGVNKGNYGKGHEVAVALGMKKTNEAAR